MEKTYTLADTQRFLNWMRKQDPNKEYRYYDNRECPIAQFITYDTGHLCSVAIGGGRFINKDDEEIGTIKIPYQWDYPLMGHGIKTTFGEAVKEMEIAFADSII